MKKFLLLLSIVIWGHVYAKAQVWYYIPAGESSETFNGTVILIIKDNGNNLWHIRENANTLRNNLLQDNNYYSNAFNKSKYVVTGGSTSIFGIVTMDMGKKKTDYNSKVFNSKYFEKLALIESTSKCYVYKKNYANIKYAISLDFNTFIDNPEVANPHYYVSCPVEKFIVRRSIDDLF